MISELLLWEGRKPQAQAQPFECDARTDAMWLLALMRSFFQRRGNAEVF